MRAGMVGARRRLDAQAIEPAIRRGEEFARLILQAELEYSGYNLGQTLTAESRRIFYNLLASVEAWARTNGATEQLPQYSGDVGADLARLQTFVAKELARLHVEQDEA